MKQLGITDVRVAINISAQQLRHDNLLLLVRGALSCYDLSPEDTLRLVQHILKFKPKKLE